MAVNLKWKVIDENKIKVWGTDSMKVKISVMPKEPYENQWWYSPAQYIARLLMMVRNINISYRQQRSMTLPGFIPNIGDAFGQRTGSVLSPGLDFAFGLAGESYLQKALDNDWLLCNDSVATPSTMSKTEDLQLSDIKPSLYYRPADDIASAMRSASLIWVKSDEEKSESQQQPGEQEP